MIKSKSSILIIALLLSVAFCTESFAGDKHSALSKSSGKSSGSSKKKSSGGKEKSFKSMIKDKVVTEGLFTFYRDTTDNTVLMAITPEQIGEIYLCGMTVSHGDGAFREGSRMHGTFPFYFKRVGKKIMLMEKNLRVRADSTLPIFGSVQSGISDGLIASTTIKSKPEDSTEAILINPSVFFVRDALNNNYFIGQQGRTGLGLDKKNSYFGEIQSFDNNSEIDVHLHYRTSKPIGGAALQNNYSFFHVFHYSLSSLPETDYVPRFADDRIGNFMTIYQDYNSLDNETPYVRYIDRFHLKKKNPDARISEPVEPIVFWVENTVPEEYRDAIAEGIEMWQTAFEAIGFRNAIVAKQMPADAEWDPADSRYNTVRWLVAKNYPYVAIGTSRQNPYTGQTYDADIGFVSEAIRSFFTRFERSVNPVSSTIDAFEEYDPYDEIPEFDPFTHDEHECKVGNAAYESAFAMAYIMASTGDFEGKSDLAKEFVHSFLTFVVAHEVGHTLGFRHNFIASTIYNMDQINDPEFTKKNSMVGTFMDYPAANVAGPGKTQGEFYASTPGPYDYWVIEYSYSDFGSASPDEEVEQLLEIAERASEPELAYASDEDTYGSSTKSVNPLSNVWDTGDDPIAFCEHSINLSNAIFDDLLEKFETDGTRYVKIRGVFASALSPYMRAATIVPKYVGGLYHKRMRVGDYDNVTPFEVVPASEQRRAMKFLRDNIFAANAFDFSPDLLNKLVTETMDDFAGTSWTRRTVDYQLHKTVIRIQMAAISRLYSGYVIDRLIENENRTIAGAEKYTLYDMFTETRRSIWTEIVKPENVNSFRRQLQLAHLERTIGIYLTRPGSYASDARTLAANDLNILKAAASKAAGNSGINGMTKAHYNEVVRQIVAAQGAERDFAPSMFR